MPNTIANKAEEFGPIRKLIWPIYNYELKKFLPLGFIMFCILFNYTLLRDTKDTLIVNSAGAGAITFLKLYCVTPMAILFVVMYAKLSNVLSRENVFYVVVTPFLIFFGAFAFIIYPNLELLHPSKAWIEQAIASYPTLSGFINIIGYWSYSLFYVLAEIWGSAMIALMFWQFANHIVRMSESKRFYGLFMVIGNLALIFSGQCVRFCSEDIKQFYHGPDTWQMSLYLMMSAVVIMGVLAMAIYRWMHVNVLTDPRYYDEAAGKPKKKKTKPGLKESFKIIFSSPELGLIAVLIMAYGVTINLVEVQWKGQLGIYCGGDKGAYNAFMGNFSTVSGIVIILFGWLIGSNILRILSWFKSAVITPTFILIGGSAFFCFILSTRIDLFKGFVESMLNMFSRFNSSVAAAAFLGAAIVLLSKAVKYSLFDPTKEMAYIPLDDELKTKGKAAVDVIGGRAGKAGGAFVQSTLLMIFATNDVVSIAPIAFGVFALVALLWIFAVKLLANKVDIAMERKDEELRKEAEAKKGSSNAGVVVQLA